MPMSPRLLRPRATGTVVVASDADARAYVLAVNAADGQPLEPAVQLAINDFIVGCKTDGIWSAIKASCILMGARTLSGALTPLVGSAPTNFNFVAGDYNRKTGLIGNGSTKYLDSGRAGNADPQANAHYAVYVSTRVTDATTRYYCGVSFSDLVYATSSTGEFRLRGNNITPPGLASASGFLGAARSDAITSANGNLPGFEYRFSGATAYYIATPGTAPSANWFLYARNNGGPQGYSGSRLAFYSFGEGLSLPSLDSRISTLYTAIGAAIP